MSPLRRNLDQLRRDHHAAHYPGDLADDVFAQLNTGGDDTGLRVDGEPARGPSTRIAPGRPECRRLVLPLSLTAAMAAAIAVVVTLAAVRLSGPSNTEIVQNTSEPTPTIPSLPDVPTVDPDVEVVAANSDTAEQPDETAAFTVVPAVSAAVGEERSLVPAAPNFDFSYSDIASASSVSEHELTEN